MKFWTFTFPPGKGSRRCSIASVSIKQAFGTDEEVAVGFAKARGGDARVYLEELVRSCIVKVDDLLISQPYGGFDTWSRQTREKVIGAWTSINGISAKEVAAFVESAIEDVSGGWRFTVPKVDPKEPFSERKLCEIKSIVAREITGKEEASALAKAKAENVSEQNARVVAATASIDGSIVDPDSFIALSSRARRYVIEAFDQINGAGGDIDDFLLGAVEENEDVSIGAETGDEEESEIG